MAAPNTQVNNRVPRPLTSRFPPPPTTSAPARLVPQRGKVLWNILRKFVSCCGFCSAHESLASRFPPPPTTSAPARLVPQRGKVLWNILRMFISCCGFGSNHEPPPSPSPTESRSGSSPLVFPFDQLFMSKNQSQSSSTSHL